jgi:hypothetical protein
LPVAPLETPDRADFVDCGRQQYTAIRLDPVPCDVEWRHAEEIGVTEPFIASSAGGEGDAEMDYSALLHVAELGVDPLSQERIFEWRAPSWRLLGCDRFDVGRTRAGHEFA